MGAGEKYKELYTSVASRIGLGCVAIGTIVVGLPLADHLVFDMEKALAIVTTVGAWIGAECMSHKTTPEQHDVDLRNRLRSLLLRNLDFLHEHDFVGSFRKSSLQSMQEISATWLGVTYQFQDRKLLNKWAPIRGKIDDFVLHLAR